MRTKNLSFFYLDYIRSTLLNNKEYLECLFNSNKPLVIYKVKNGFNVYTDLNAKD